ncbi:MAG: YCF48-related protein [Nitrospinae bacterium]|nr:YCF48-related protein [Nitrospinota bacterium]
MNPAASGILRRLSPRILPALVFCLLPFGAANAQPAVEARLAPKSLLLDGASAGARLVVVGERGHVLVSADGGVSWKQARVPVRALLTAVHMHDARIGWAVGHDAVILRTEDGGLTWRVAHHAPEEERPLLDVWFRDERVGFAVGAYGYFLATSDGGHTWKPRTIDKDDFHLNAIVPAGPSRLFIAGEAGAIYRSDDGGGAWRKLPSPYTGSWFSALPLDADRLLLLGLRGSMFRSENGGESWTQVSTRTKATLTGALLVKPGLLLVTGLEGALLVSRDGGRSVSTDAVFRPLTSRLGISKALALSGGGVLLLGEFGAKRLPGAR